jgi:hypothetical protein
VLETVGSPYLTLAAAILGSVGWAMWLVARRDRQEFKDEAQDAHWRLRIAIGQASARRSAEAAELQLRLSAEAQMRVYAAELSGLRHALRLAEADRASLQKQVEALGSDPGGKLYDSAAGRLRLYRPDGS